MPREWSISLYKDLLGEVSVGLYEVEENGRMRMVADERFGPFDTGVDVLTWVARHWCPRAHLPLR